MITTQYFAVKDSSQYDNAVFGLQLSTVGEDVAKNDFFENIPENASADYLATAPTPPPAAESTPEGAAEADVEADWSDEDEDDVTAVDPEYAQAEISEADEAAPAVETATQAPEAQPVDAPAQTTRERGGGLPGGLMIVAGLGVAGGGVWYAATHLTSGGRRRRGKKRK